MATVASAEIEVTADATPFLPALKRQVKKAQASAAKMGSSIGERIGKALSKGVEKQSSKMGLAMGGLVAILPLLTSAASALAGGIVALTGSLLRGASSALSAVGVMGSLAQAAIVGKIAFGGLSDAIQGTEGAMAKLSPAGQALAKTIKGLGPSWQNFRNAIQQTALSGLAPVLQGVADKFLGPGSIRAALKGTGTQLNLLFKDIGRFVQSESFVTRFSDALRGNNRIFGILRKAAVPLLNGLLNLFRALQPSAERLAEKIVSVARGFSQWTKGEGFAKRVDGFMRKAAESASLLWRFVKNLGIALWNVTQIGADGGDGLLKTWGDLAIRFRNFTESAEGIRKIGGWISESLNVLRSFGRIIMQMGGLFKALFNPAIAGGFFGMIEKLIPTIKAVTGVIGDALGPIFDKVGAALAENGPKIAKFFVALGPLLKGVGAVIGEVISQAIGIIGTVASILTPVVGLISKYLGPALEKLAPVIAAVILGFGGLAFRLISLFKYLGPLGKLFAWIIGPIVRLGGAIFSGIGAALKFIGPLVMATFRMIAKAVVPTLKIVGRIISTVFGAARTVISTVMRVIWSVISTVWRAIAAVVRAVLGPLGTAIKTYFTVYKTVITSVLKAIWAVVRVVWNVIRTVITTAVKVIGKIISTTWNVIKTVTRTVWNGIKAVITGVANAIRAVVSRVWNGIKALIGGVMRTIQSIISKAWNAVSSATSRVFSTLQRITGSAMTGLQNLVRKGLDTVVNFVKDIPSRILAIGASMLSAGKDIGGKIIDGILSGLRAAGGFVSDLMSSITGAINDALNLPFTIKGPGPLPDFTIPAFAKGTRFAPGGVALVGERGPELVTLPRGSKVDTAAKTRAAASGLSGGGFPRKVILRIGNRDFEAYVSEVADGRIEAADSLAYQGA